MNESISVIIPAYNSEKFIGQSVASVLRQECLPDEIIIVDDGSTDRTREIVENLITARKDSKPTIKYIAQKNQGPAAARNTGVKNSAGEYLALLDADDSWAPSRLSKQLAVFRARPEVGLVCTGRVRIDEITGQRTIHCIGSTLSSDSYYDLWAKGNFITTSSVLVRKKCFEAAGLFDEDQRVLGSEDVEMWIRIAEKFPIAYVDEPLVEYLIRQGGLNRSNIKRTHESAIFIFKRHEPEFLKRYPDAASVMTKKWGRVYHSWGAALFNNEQFAEAKIQFQKALTFSRFSQKTLKFYLLTLLGGSALLAFKRWKRILRRGSVPTQSPVS